MRTDLVEANSGNQIPSWLPTVSKIAALLTLFFGLIGITGWIFHLDFLLQLNNGLPFMTPNTASMFVLLGLSLGILRHQTEFLPLRILGQFFALIVALGGGAILAEYILGWKPGIDLMFFGDTLRTLNIPLPGRPSVFTSINFFLMGSALLLSRFPHPFILKICEVFAVITLQISLLALVGYVCHIPLYYGWRSLFPGTGMALHTLTAFVVLGLGFLAAIPHCGLTKLLCSRTTGGVIIRRLILAPVLIPLIIGLIERVSEYLGVHNAEIASWLFAFLNIFLLTGIIWWIARLLHKADLVRLKSENDIQNLNQILEKGVEERTAKLSEVLKQIRDSEERMRLVLDSALDAVIVIDAKGVITSWNPEAERIFGWSRSEILGKTLTESIIPHQHRGSHLRGMEHHAATGKGPVLNKRIEITALRRTGEEFPVELAITPIRTGEHISFSAFLRDITDRKKSEAEIKALNTTLEERVRDRTSQLEEANKELEAFSYSVSHDLRTPLRHIEGFVDLLKEEASPVLTGDAKRYLEIICKSADKMEVLIDDLLEFSRNGRKEMNFGKIDFADLISEVIQESSGEQVGRTVHWDIGQLPLVNGDRPLLKLVWVNLLSNALKYTRQRPEAKITIRSCVLESGLLEFSIEDNGAGFDMDYSEKLFGVFQRLHREEEFEGTGIGLANVRRIILRHGGNTRAKGFVGQGATFYFTLHPPSEIQAKAGLDSTDKGDR